MEPLWTVADGLREKILDIEESLKNLTFEQFSAMRDGIAPDREQARSEDDEADQAWNEAEQARQARIAKYELSELRKRLIHGIGTASVLQLELGDEPETIPRLAQDPELLRICRRYLGLFATSK